MEQAILDINKIIEINEFRTKLESSMENVTLLNTSRSQLQERLNRAVKRSLHELVTMYELQISTTTNVLETYRKYMMDTWHKLEGIEDQLIDHGMDEEEAELLVWGQD